MRAFVRLREFLSSQAKLGKKLRELEQRTGEHHESIQVFFEAIQQLTSERPSAIVFSVDTDSDTTGPQEKHVVKESRAIYRTRRPASSKAKSGRHDL